MADCQVGGSPSMLTAYNCILIIADNTDKEKKENQKHAAFKNTKYLKVLDQAVCLQYDTS